MVLPLTFMEVLQLKQFQVLIRMFQRLISGLWLLACLEPSGHWQSLLRTIPRFSKFEAWTMTNGLMIFASGQKMSARYAVQSLTIERIQMRSEAMYEDLGISQQS